MSDSARLFRVRVTDLRTGERKANVALPIGLMRMGIRIGTRFAPEALAGLDVDEIVAAARADASGKIVDIEDEDRGERVEVFVD